MKAIIGATAVLSMILSASSAAALVGCKGQVTQIQLRSDGRVEADWGWGWRIICNMSADTAAPTDLVKKEACAGLYSQFVTALSTGQYITSYHGVSTTCDQALTAGTNEWPGEQPYGYIISR